MNRRQFLGWGAVAVSVPMMATLSGCTTNQLLGAANLVENGDVPVVELAYGAGERQRCDVYRPLDGWDRRSRSKGLWRCWRTTASCQRCASRTSPMMWQRL